MAKVTGIGGVFLRSPDRKSLIDWYADNLGMESAKDFVGTMFKSRNADNPDQEEWNIVGLFDNDTDYFGPENPPFMVNFRVDDLNTLLATLRGKGITVDEKTEYVEGIGHFGWIVDPEGRRIELWQPETPSAS